MFDSLGWPFDISGFVARRNCGDWSPSLIWMHVGSDLFIWLAYLSIPLALVFFTRVSRLPYPRLLLLFAVFIFACGTTHLIEALMFQYPLYRLSGLMKFVTAVASWATVIGIISVLPRVAQAMDADRAIPSDLASTPTPTPRAARMGDTKLHRAVMTPPRNRQRAYIMAILIGVLAVLIRGAMASFVKEDHMFVITLLAVVFVAWQSGFGPAVVTLLISLLGTIYWFIGDNRSLIIEAFELQLAVAMFFFCGMCCAALGEGQRIYRQRAKEALGQALARKAELEEEVARRRAAEVELRESEARLRVLAEAVPQMVWATRPDGYADYFNRRWEKYTGQREADSTGWGWTDVVHPDDKEKVATRWRESFETGNDYEVEYRMRNRDGEYRWFLAQGRPERNAKGQIVRWFGTNTDIHDAMLAAEQIRESQLFLEATINALTKHLAVLDTDGTILKVNESWRQFGVKNGSTCPRHYVGRNYLEACEESEIGREIATGLREVIAGTRKEFESEYPCHAPTEKRWFLLRVSRFPGDGPVRVVVTHENITKRVMAELEVRENEEKFRTLADNMSQLAWMTDETGWIHWYNQRWFEYTGTTLEQMQGWGWKAVHHPDHIDRVVQKISHCFETGTFWEDTFPLRGADGQYRWFLSRAIPIRDGSGRIVRWFGTNTDITDRLQMEDAIADAANRFQTLAEAIPNIVWTATPDGNVDYYSPNWYDYTGATFEQTRGRGWLNIIHPDEREEGAKLWAAALADTTGIHEVEQRLRRLDGEYRWFIVRGLRVESSDGQGRWVGTLTDIHDRKTRAETLEQMVRDRTRELELVNSALVDEIEDRKAAEERVRAVATELERSNEELEKFAYVASHDLQEPLRKIQAFGDRLVTRCRDELSDIGKEYVDRILNSAGRMRRLIDDLLTFSRVTTQGRPFVRLDLKEVVSGVISDLEERIASVGATVNVAELPEIDGDALQMRQLFQNLIANALKFRQPDVPPVVDVRSEPDLVPAIEGEGKPTSAVRITVRDNGIGFDEKYLDRIFEMFQRLHGRFEYEGTGVGLAICKKIVDRHGGAITAHSREGEGATFVVVLPARHPQSHEADPT